MANYQKSPPKRGMEKPETDSYVKIRTDGELKKPEGTKPILETPPPPKRRTREVKKEIQEFVLCPKDCVINLFGCDTKAYYCPSNCTSDGCTCDQVCRDSDCSMDCEPNCRCDSYCRDCDDCSDSRYCGDCNDRGCCWDRPGCMGHCLNDWD